MSSINTLLEMIADNTRRTGFPLPAPKAVVYSWAKNIEIPKEGDYLLFTGGLYQLVPYINSLVKYLESLGSHKSTGRIAFKLAKSLGKIIDFSKLAKPDKKDVQYSSGVLQSITSLLIAGGVNFHYRPDTDAYSGILLYDMGLEHEFSSHAEKVYERLLEHGVSKVITVDPHTTFALRNVYPKYIDNYNIEVYNYLELLENKLEQGKLVFKEGDKGSLVIHDPCYYARFDNILEQPRKLLEAAGYKVLEPRRTGKMTYCCGGPVEAISPLLAQKIAETRIEELGDTSNRIVVLCPICYANLSRVAGELEVRDISLYLADALG